MIRSKYNKNYNPKNIFLYSRETERDSLGIYCKRCEKYCYESLKIRNPLKNEVENICFQCIELDDLKKNGYWQSALFYQSTKGNYKRRY